MPRLTGYILIGIFFGPELAGLISTKMLSDLALVKGTAVGLIAFLAGCELNLRKLRPRLRAIGIYAVLTMAGAVLLLFALFFGITYILPVSAQFSVAERLVVAMIAANVLAAYSPAVVVGILSETRARGPLSEAALSIVVLADLAIVVTYALTSTAGRAVFPDEAQGDALAMLVPHIFGSIAAGLVAGAVLALYASRVRSRSGMFTFAVLFVSAEAGAALHLNPLLIGLTAGLLLENVTAIGGEEMSKAAESVAMPTLAIFFAVVGAEVQMRAFLHTAPYAIGAAVLRGLGIYAGALLAARLVPGGTRVFARRLTLGLLPQAGVAIALAALLLAEFRPWGAVVGTIVLGSIIVNQLIGPVLFRNALVAAGEAGAEEPVPEAPAPATEPA
jgi:Kef-type K+ transport system membrane component KefB